MKATIIFNTGKPNEYTQALELNPQCNDFCDSCGDCLKCNEEELCALSSDGKHSFVIYDDAFTEPGGLNEFLSKRY